MACYTSPVGSRTLEHSVFRPPLTRSYLSLSVVGAVEEIVPGDLYCTEGLAVIQAHEMQMEGFVYARRQCSRLDKS